MGFIDEFADCMPGTLTATPGTEDGLGSFVASGSVQSLACRIEGEARLVRDPNGREVVSSVQAYVGSAPGLTVDGYRYGLPARFPSPADPSGHRAISVEHVADEDGAEFEVVMLP